MSHSADGTVPLHFKHRCCYWLVATLARAFTFKSYSRVAISVKSACSRKQCVKDKVETDAGRADSRRSLSTGARVLRSAPGEQIIELLWMQSARSDGVVEFLFAEFNVMHKKMGVA
jgi:hypothetical protein